MQAATGGFPKGARLGGGASCSVYEGELYGLRVAVKHLHRVSAPGGTDRDGLQWAGQQFAAEMKLLCR